MTPACEKDTIIYSIRCHSRRDMALQDYQASGVFDNYAAIKENTYHKTTADLKTLMNKKIFLDF